MARRLIVALRFLRELWYESTGWLEENGLAVPFFWLLFLAFMALGLWQMTDLENLSRRP